MDYEKIKSCIDKIEQLEKIRDVSFIPEYMPVIDQMFYNETLNDKGKTLHECIKYIEAEYQRCINGFIEKFKKEITNE